MGLKVSLWVLINSYGSLWVFIGPCVSLKVIMGLLRSLCVCKRPYGF